MSDEDPIYYKYLSVGCIHISRLSKKYEYNSWTVPNRVIWNQNTCIDDYVIIVNNNQTCNEYV